MTFSPPYPPYDPTDKSGYETVVVRWPVIVTAIVDHLHNVCNELVSENSEQTEAKIQEGKKIIARISELKYHMGRDHVMEPIPDDGEPYVDLYNGELRHLAERKQNTWFTAPWLYAECYLYRLIRSFFAQTEHWNQKDPFFAQKVKMFKQSGNSILQIATTVHEMESLKASLMTDPDKLSVLFREMLQMCLWYVMSRSDLSLLTHLSASDIEHLQAVGKDAQAARQQFILRDNQDKAWEHISSMDKARIDFVLDNSGFELFTDLVFADFLVTFTPHVGKVVFHPKLIPWFVSDVTPPDFAATLSSLKEAEAFFSINSPSNAESFDHLRRMVTRWERYLEQGVFALSVPLNTPLGGNRSAVTDNAAFWTSPHPYWDLRLNAPELFKELRESGLVILKVCYGLTGDIKWPGWTSLTEALGTFWPLAGSFPLLSLRTNKADVIVGVERATVERLDRSGEKWRVDGR
ncbi:hypothetical protein AMATHDRAFT_151339 [Amanita thiersii Skay4041]|uniref:Sugar phosphate phosphatase n=1 Tax=Amanita thiersii Skay4041 TaxID=703135 RepID=A0A2A9NJ83_9AGAR|nr:hypothetical protein AMATHDRAFT_151339 [Amanita thiersii Skay4041]